MHDLHSRTIGSRLMDAGRSAYFYTWQRGDDVRLYDPNLFLPNGLNGVTATPPFLWMTKYFSKLNYCDVKLYWWLLQEILLFATLWLTSRMPSNLLRQLITIVLAIAFFCYSRNWWLHMYAGQYYIVFTFLLALSAYLLTRSQSNRVSLLLLPVFGLLRPFFIFSALPLLFKFSKEKLLALAIGGCIALTILFASGTWKSLTDYNKAMQLYAQENTVGFKSDPRIKDPREPALAVEECVKVVTEKTYNAAGCLFSLQHYLKFFRLYVDDTKTFMVILVIAIGMLFLLLGKKRIAADHRAMVLTSFLVYMLCELITPASRNPYNLIQYLAIVGVLVDKSSLRGLILLITGLALNHDIPFRFAYQREVGELLVLLSIFIAIRFPAKQEVTTSKL